VLAAFTVGIAAIAVVYYPLWISGQFLAVSGTLPAILSVWAAPVLVGGGGAVWLSRMV
jgi:lipopolysaccharide export LptBFGC system permease protein LptF